ncbi:MAG: methylglyoxal synthase [Candidatus Thiothrix moscowensis]|nr:methylglyoxal synthase [Candidatus Thiothrix moscowensis]
MQKQRIALVAHDNLKPILLSWVKENRQVLAGCELFATGTTGKLLQEHTGLDVICLLSGPYGGDQQIGAKISEGKIDILIFFWDPLSPVPHDADVKALLRMATLMNIPVANNQSTADCVLAMLQLDKPSHSGVLYQHPATHYSARFILPQPAKTKYAQTEGKVKYKFSPARSVNPAH